MPGTVGDLHAVAAKIGANNQAAQQAAKATAAQIQAAKDARAAEAATPT